MKRYGIIVLLCVTLHSLACHAGAATDQRRLVRVGAFNFYPAIFQDKDGAVKGFFVDMLADIAGKEKMRIEYVYGSWQEGLDRLHRGEVDVLTSVAYTAERAATMDFGRTPLLTVWGELYVTNESHVDGILDLEGKTVAIMKGDFNARHFINLAEKFGIHCEFREVDGFDGVFTAVKNHTADAGVASTVFGSARQREYGLKSTGVVFNPFDIFFVVAKGRNAELLETLDHYLHHWRTVENTIYHQARQKWSHGNAATIPVIPRWLNMVLIALVGATVAAGVIIVLFRVQVRRKTAELMESQNLFATVANTSPALVWMSGLDKGCFWFNAPWLAFVGRTLEQEQGNGWTQGVHPDDYDRCLQIYLEAFDARQPFSMAYRLRRHDGIYRWILDQGQPRYDAEGKFVGYIGSCLDIDEQKEAEEALFKAEQKSQQLAHEQQIILNTISIGVIYLKERKVLWCNPAFDQIFGYDPGSTIGFDTATFYTDRETYEQLGTEGYATIASGEVYATEVVMKRKDGSHVWCGIVGQSVDPRRPEEGSIWLFQDISVRKQVESELLDKNAELESFTYTVSHDLKSPLITIQSFAGMITQDLAKGHQENIPEDLQRIIDAAGKMTELLNDLLELSRIGRIMNAPVSVDMNRVVENILQQLAGTLGQRQVEVVVQQGFPQVIGDAQRIEEVVQNLVENAIKYLGDQPEPLISIGSRVTGSELVFFVRDNGIGIDPRFQENIFGLFKKLDPRTEGTGIGLALVKRIIEVHGGRVWAESKGGGQGSTFCFTLPEWDKGAQEPQGGT